MEKNMNVEVIEARNRIKEIVAKQQRLKMELSDTNSQLVQELADFKGSVSEAIGLGLVKPNFPTPYGYRAYCRELVGKE